MDSGSSIQPRSLNHSHELWRDDPFAPHYHKTVTIALAIFGTMLFFGAIFVAGHGFAGQISYALPKGAEIAIHSAILIAGGIIGLGIVCYSLVRKAEIIEYKEQRGIIDENIAKLPTVKIGDRLVVHPDFYHLPYNKTVTTALAIIGVMAIVSGITLGEMGLTHRITIDGLSSTAHNAIFASILGAGTVGGALLLQHCLLRARKNAGYKTEEENRNSFNRADRETSEERNQRRISEFEAEQRIRQEWRNATREATPPPALLAKENSTIREVSSGMQYTPSPGITVEVQGD